MGDPLQVFERLQFGDRALFKDESGEQIGHVIGRSAKRLPLVRKEGRKAAKAIRPDQLIRQVAA